MKEFGFVFKEEWYPDDKIKNITENGKCEGIKKDWTFAIPFF